MAKPKKTSIQGQVDQLNWLQKIIESPITLTDRERFYFDSIVQDREAQSWSIQHLIFAANLAKTLVQLDEANADIAIKGMQTLTDKGWPAPNPMVGVKTQLTNSVINQMKALGMTASQKGLSTPEQKTRNKSDAQVRASLSEIDDDLI